MGCPGRGAMGRMPVPSAPRGKPAREHFVPSPTLPALNQLTEYCWERRSHKLSNHQLEKLQINANMVSFPSTALVRGFSPQADGMGYKYIYSSGEFAASPPLLQAFLQALVLGRLFLPGPKKGGCPCQSRIYMRMWLRREVSFGAAWHPHPEKASRETGQRGTSTTQQKNSRVEAGQSSIHRETLDSGRAQLPQSGAAPKASLVSCRQELGLYFSPKACFHSSSLLCPSSICLD